ncbi:MAG: IS3 family transposase [Bacteroidetes bacterium]|nr:MAG: IS3 family transposase [Bacteroidota bacterium]
MKSLCKLVEKKNKQLRIRRQCSLLGINRSSLYYKPLGESKENLKLMEKIDRLFLEDPTLGVLGMQDELREMGLNYNVKRIRRLMRKMSITPIYPKRNLSKSGKAEYIYPYLLRGLKIDRPNQVWAIDITYIPMKEGFMYFTVIIDLYSRYIVGWQLSNSMEKETQTELLQEAIAQYGKPEIINSDQGSQYTSENWVSFLKEKQIAISMNGRGRATDNAIVERFIRTIKLKHIYLYPAESVFELYEGINRFIKKYQHRRHQGIGRKRPVDLYSKAA